MKVEIGFLDQSWGTIEEVKGKLELRGKRKKLLSVVESLGKNKEPKEFLTSLPNLLQGHMWAILIN